LKGTPTWQKYYRCPCKLKTVLKSVVRKNRGPIRIGKDGKTGSNIGWYGRPYLVCANWKAGQHLSGCQEFVWYKKDKADQLPASALPPIGPMIPMNEVNQITTTTTTKAAKAPRMKKKEPTKKNLKEQEEQPGEVVGTKRVRRTRMRRTDLPDKDVKKYTSKTPPGKAVWDFDMDAELEAALMESIRFGQPADLADPGASSSSSGSRNSTSTSSSSSSADVPPTVASEAPFVPDRNFFINLDDSQGAPEAGNDAAEDVIVVESSMESDCAGN